MLSHDQVQDLNDTFTFLSYEGLYSEELSFNMGGIDFQIVSLRTRDQHEPPVVIGMEVPTAETFEFPVSWELVQTFYETVVQFAQQFVEH